MPHGHELAKGTTHLLHCLHSLGVLLHPEQNMALPKIALDYTTQFTLHITNHTKKLKPTKLGIDLDSLLGVLQRLRECHKLRVRVSPVIVPTWIGRITLD